MSQSISYFIQIAIKIYTYMSFTLSYVAYKIKLYKTIPFFCFSTAKLSLNIKNESFC